MVNMSCDLLKIKMSRCRNDNVTLSPLLLPAPKWSTSGMRVTLSYLVTMLHNLLKN